MSEDSKTVEERLEALEKFLPMLERRYGKRVRRNLTVPSGVSPEVQQALTDSNNMAKKLDTKLESVGSKKRK